MRVTTTVMLALLVCIGPSFAGVDPCDGPSYRHGGQCVSDKLVQAEQELEKAYKAALTRARDEDGYRLESGSPAMYESLLRESQRTWQAYTEVDCELAGLATGAGGGWVGVQTSECVLQSTKRRTDVLRGLWAG